MNLKNAKQEDMPASTDKKFDFFASRILIPPYKPEQTIDIENLKVSNTLYKTTSMPRKIKHIFYSKPRDLTSVIEYEKNEYRFERGLQICLMNFRDELTDILSHDLQYIYFEKDEMLVFSVKGNLEIVPILDMHRFKNELKTLMNEGDNAYSTRHCTWMEIQQLITMNGGHAPHSMPASEVQTPFLNRFDNPLFLMGGPPSKPPVFGKKIIVHSEDEVKIDSEGNEYTGMPLK